MHTLKGEESKKKREKKMSCIQCACIDSNDVDNNK